MAATVKHVWKKVTGRDAYYMFQEVFWDIVVHRPVSYAYYGFWHCQRCQKHVEGFDREPHEMWHRLKEAP